MAERLWLRWVGLFNSSLQCATDAASFKFSLVGLVETTEFVPTYPITVDVEEQYLR